MKLLKLLFAMVVAPLLMALSAFADEGKEEAAAVKPSLTYYYFDG